MKAPQIKLKNEIAGTKPKYDLLIAPLGFESRSTHVSRAAANRAMSKVAFGFTDQQVHAYAENKIWFSDHGFDVKELSDEEIEAECVNVILKATQKQNDRLQVLVDISSFSRLRIASMVAAFSKTSLHQNLIVDFLYSPASFLEAGNRPSYNVHVGPVLTDFAGWWIEPDLPLAVIAGLGYEKGKALGAVEHVQAATTWLFEPVSELSAYYPRMLETNKELIESTRPDQIFQYEVSKPLDLFIQLESLATGLLHNHNVLIFPFGPKLFSVCALLLSLVHREVSVWRVSGGKLEDAVDRSAAGPIYGLSAEFVSPIVNQLATSESVLTP
jgi:hypothetical protein